MRAEFLKLKCLWRTSNQEWRACCCSTVITLSPSLRLLSANSCIRNQCVSGINDFSTIIYKIIIFFFWISGRFLISYISVWQDFLKSVCSSIFEFNTYIISVLVIFFLQMNYNLPTINKLSDYTSCINIPSYKEVPRQFFNFYGNIYSSKSHVISLHIGQWKQIHVESQQKHFSAAEKRFDFYRYFWSFD